MNILYLNHYAGAPALGMEYRPYYLAREWVKLGHKVMIVAADFSHVRARQPKRAPPAGARASAPGDEIIDGIEYRWIATPPYQGNGVARMRNIVAYLTALWGQAGALARDFRPDVVIASSTYPLDIWPARRIARLAGARLVHEVHDLWPLSPIELSGMSPWHPFAILCQQAENTACRDADVVVSMLPRVHEHMARHGLDLKKLRIVPNGITPDEWLGTPPPLDAAPAAAIASACAERRTIVGYAGSMGLPNALAALLDAAQLLRDEPFAFVLVGDGHEHARLERRVTDEGLIVEFFDIEGAPLFEGETAVPMPVTTELAGVIARVFGIVANQVAVNGHVRARPDILKENPEWDLSASRAMQMRALIEAAANAEYYNRQSAA